MSTTLVICLGDWNKTKIVATQRKNSNIYVIEKYQNPNTNACLDINSRMIAEIDTAITPSPFAYQTAKAINGETAVITAHTIM